MAVIEKEAPAVQVGRQAPRRGWLLGALVVVALTSVAVAALMVSRSGNEGPAAPVARPARPAQGESVYTAREQAVMQLVNQGLIPASTLEGEPYRTKRLVNEGIVPRAALEPWTPPVAPLYTGREQALMAAVAAGTVPKETLDAEPFRTKRLVNQVLIPRQSLDTGS